MFDGRPGHLPQFVEKLANDIAARIPKARIAFQNIVRPSLSAQAMRLLQHEQRRLQRLDMQIIQHLVKYRIVRQQTGQQHQLAVAAPAIKQAAQAIVAKLPQGLAFLASCALLRWREYPTHWR